MLASQLGGQQPQLPSVECRADGRRSVQAAQMAQKIMSCAHCQQGQPPHNPECTSAEHDGWELQPSTGDAANADPGEASMPDPGIQPLNLDPGQYPAYSIAA